MLGGVAPQLLGGSIGGSLLFASLPYNSFLSSSEKNQFFSIYSSLLRLQLFFFCHKKEEDCSIAQLHVQLAETI